MGIHAQIAERSLRRHQQVDRVPGASKRRPLLIESFPFNASKFIRNDTELGRNPFTRVFDRLALVLEVHQHAKDFLPLAFIEVVIQGWFHSSLLVLSVTSRPVLPTAGAKTSTIARQSAYSSTVASSAMFVAASVDSSPCSFFRRRRSRLASALRFFSISRRRLAKVF
jgi:hypothetical protein